MPDTTNSSRSRRAATGRPSRTARRQARWQARRRRRWYGRAAAVLALLVGVAGYVLATRGGGVRPVMAQALTGMRPAPRLLTEAEVEAGIARRLDAMRQRRAQLVARAAAREVAEVAAGRAVAGARVPLPRDPAPVPEDAAAGVPE